MKIAIVHDWLVTFGGAERVLEQILLCYPQADLFSLVDFLPEPERGFLLGRKVRTSFVQHLPGARKHYRHYLPLMPLAVEQFDLTGYDLILSSSHAVAKGVIVSPDQLHLCMCYSPMRYAWDMQHQYLREAKLDKGVKGWLVRQMLHKLRLWDTRTAHGVDQFIAISHFIARRIRKAYHRDSVIIYPPVDLENFQLQVDKADYYFTASRHVPYKKIPMIVEAFKHMPDRRLIVMGDGPDLDRCRALAGPNVHVLGHRSSDELREHLQRAKAFIFAAEEDFGIAPLEAQACGTPVIAFGKGGALETLRGLSASMPTAIFFEEQTVFSIVQAVQTFEAEQACITSQACRQNAERFEQARFRREFVALVTSRWSSFIRQKTQGTT